MEPGTELGRADAAALAAQAVYSCPRLGQPMGLGLDLVVDRSMACTAQQSGFSATGFVDRKAQWLVLAICGSDEPLDIASCANLAICQYQPNRKALLDYAADPTWRHVTLTGHSLGGAVCQYLAYDLTRGEAGMGERLDVWTFNGLGGQTGLQRLHGMLSPPDLNRLHVTHYAHPSDVVPHIGGNIGGSLRVLETYNRGADSHAMVHFLPKAGRSALDSFVVVPDRPFGIAKTAECLGPRLREAVLAWLDGRRLAAAMKLLSLLPSVPREERREVLRLLKAMADFPRNYRRAMRAVAQRRKGNAGLPSRPC